MPEGSAGPFPRRTRSSRSHGIPPGLAGMAGGLGRPRPRRPGCATDGRARPRTVHPHHPASVAQRLRQRRRRGGRAGQGDGLCLRRPGRRDPGLQRLAGTGRLAGKPLESHLYGSRQAGEYLPLAIKRLLDERAPASRDLANVYLQCLILGFRGRLRRPRGEALHEKWRQALFAFAWQREADAADLGRRLEQPAARATAPAGARGAAGRFPPGPGGARPGAADERHRAPVLARHPA